MRVRFLRDELYENEGRNQGHLFQEGEEYDFEEAFAQRWLRRNAAELVDGDGKAVDPEQRFTPLNVIERRDDAEPSDAVKRAEKGEADRAAAAKRNRSRPSAVPKAPAKPARAPAKADKGAPAPKAADAAKVEAPAADAAAEAPGAAAPAQLPLEPPRPGQAG